ncbi:MAG: 5-deoxy-D-glucuronate isomerase [Pontimonas sp.]|jgi:5-deoxy-D-glucuronate isomerase
MPEPRVNLFSAQDSGITDIMDGPWKNIDVTTLAPGESKELTTESEEHCVFTIDGSAQVTEPDGRSWDFVAGNTVSLPHGGRCTITAGDDGMRYLIITMTVD